MLRRYKVWKTPEVFPYKSYYRVNGEDLVGENHLESKQAFAG